MALFGAMGLMLAAIGIYGVMAYTVAQRTREIGIRAALGATRADLLLMVFGQSVMLATYGIVIGLALALAAGRLLGALLFAVSPADTFVLAGATGVLMFVALMSAVLPARRAAAVDPIVALRAE
jgi:ABC-type antimicrobial peptide transport system permease subunit